MTATSNRNRSVKNNAQCNLQTNNKFEEMLSCVHILWCGYSRRLSVFFVVLEQVSKCLVFLQNVRLGIDKLINVYQNHQTQALRLSTWNIKQCMEGSLFVINLLFFKATKNCVFQYHQLKFRGFFIITNQIINIPQALIEGFNSSLARNVHFWGITN